MRQFFSFPNPVNEKAARSVAAVVLAVTILTLATGWLWLIIPLAYGFWARVLTGPKLSPLGWTAMNVVGPKLGEKVYVAGPPKRFAQGLGAAITTGALLLWLAAPSHTPAEIVLALMIPAAGLESIFGLCLGCKIFAVLMRFGLVPPEVCAECVDIRGRLAAGRSTIA